MSGSPLENETYQSLVVEALFGGPGGKHSMLKLQRQMIGWVLFRLGDRAYEVYEGSGSRFNLEPILKETTEKFLPQLHPGTLRRWFYSFQKFGETPVETEDLRRRLNVGMNENMWNGDDSKLLKSIVCQNPELYLDEIQDEFERASPTGRRFAASTIWKKLTMNCNYSLQVATNRAIQISEEERARYKQDLEQIVDNPSLAVFVDESSKGRNDARRRRFWSPRGTTPFLYELFGSHDKRYTLIAACNINGFIEEACDVVEREHGALDTDPSHGTIDTNRFLLYVEFRLCPQLGNYLYREPNSVVIMDNATQHHHPRVRELIEARGAVLIYTAPYSPDLNPIELMFNLYKMALRRLQRQRHGWLTTHLLALDAVSPAHARNFFRRCGVPGCENFPDPDDYQTGRRRAFFFLLMMVVITLYGQS